MAETKLDGVRNVRDLGESEWVNWLSVWLLISGQVVVLGFEIDSCIRLYALLGVCLRFSPSPSVPPSFSLSLSN